MLARNVAATLAGQLVYPLLALALVPFYIERLGLEAYGLIGLMALTVSLMSIFTRGAGAALQREVSRRLAEGSGETLPRLVASLEVCYWILGGVLGAAIAAVSLADAGRLAGTAGLSAREATICLLALAIRVGFGLPHSVYLSSLIGAERHVLANALTAALALASAVISVTTVVVFDTVAAVFISEAASTALFLGILRYAAVRALPRGASAFDLAEVRGVLALSIGLLWTSGVGLLIGTLDRVFVSALLPISALAVYTIAALGGRLVTMLCAPFLQSAYPEMCRLAQVGTHEQQVSNVLRNMALLLVVGATVVIPLAVFSTEALSLWVGDAGVVRAGAPVLSVYAIGSLLIALASVLYQWHTAAGRVAVAARFNAAALLWFPLVLALLVQQGGLIGAAFAWLAYAIAAWITNLVTTFAADALPRRHLGSVLKITAAALAPAAILAVVARVAADQVFVDSLQGRVLLAALASVTGGLLAVVALRHHLPWRIDLITSPLNP